MIEVINLKVRSLDMAYNEVSWQIKDTSEDIFDYDFQVLRSEAMAGPYDTISIPFQDQYVFRDKHVPRMHQFRSLYYLVRVTNRLTGATYDAGPASQTPEEDLYTLEIRRHLATLYREFTGRKCWLLPIRTFGQRCPGCWDPVLFKRKRAGCMICFDTGFARGYHHPIEVWAAISTGTPMAEQNTNVGTLQQINTSARIAVVGAKPRDLLIEGENHRWRVVQVGETEHGRASVLFELQLHRIPPSDIEYSIPLELGVPLRDVELTPARQFTNPHNLSSIDREATKIFKVYTDPQRK